MFGRGIIRHFTNNVSEMKKLAGWDFEDILQVGLISIIFIQAQLLKYQSYLKCIIPIFEDLLPQEHNVIVMDLLFELATWHALAKLQIHTNKTIDLLATAMKTLTISI
jgi:hypothetical protein